MRDKQSKNAYRRANLRIIHICLAIWALVSFGFGILFRPLLPGIAVAAAPIWASGLPSKGRS